MSTKFANFIDWLERLENWLSIAYINTWHANWICQFHRLVREIRKLESWKPSDNLKSWLDPEFCPYMSSVDIRCSHAVSMITSDQLATKHSQQGLDWPTHDFVYPADCLFNNTCWACKNISCGHSAQDFHLSLLTLQFSQTAVGHTHWKSCVECVVD